MRYLTAAVEHLKLDIRLKHEDIFNGKNVVVVGYGKSALDIATLAAVRSAQR